MKEKDIIKALRERKPGGAKELVKVYGERLLRSAYLLCDNTADAEDLVQEAFVAAIKSIHRFRGSSTLYTWLHGILINVNRNHYRKGKAWRFTNTFRTKDITLPPQDAHLDMDKDSSLLARLVQQLSPTSREIVILRFYEGMKLEEIARHLNLPLSTVKTRLRRAVTWLQKNLGKSETFSD